MIVREGSPEGLRAQARLYWLVSRLFAPPQEELPRGELVRELRQIMGTLGWEDPEIVRELQDMEASITGLHDPTELAVEFTRLFRGPARAEAHPYESIYRDSEILGRTAREVLACYERAGVSISPEFKDLPDHIVAELEFVSYLCAQELKARQEGDEERAARFRHERHSFFQDHLALWLPSFAQRIARSSTSPFYRSLAGLLWKLTPRTGA